MMNRRQLFGAAAAVAGATLLETGAQPARAQAEKLRVLCWSERTEPAAIYPEGGNAVVAEFLNRHDAIHAEVASLNDPDQGIPDSKLDSIDVITWWGHQKHADVHDDRVEAVLSRVRAGKLGVVALHSSHYSKILKRGLNTSGDLGGNWGANGGTESVYVIDPKHPITRGVSDFVLPIEEWYDEPFGVPSDGHVILFSVFEATRPDGIHHNFRSGITFNVGKGKLFYFRPGHEQYPTYRNEAVQKVVTNGVLWAGGRS